MTYFIGVDIGKAFFDVNIHGQPKSHRFVNNDKGFKQLQKLIKNYLPCHIAMEATGNYSIPLASFLHKQQLKVSVVNPAKIKHYAQAKLNRVKTDSQDAKLIADYCKTQTPRLWQPAPELIAKLQHWIGFKDLLDQQRIQLNNQMNSHFDSVLKAIQARQIKRIEQEIKEIDDLINSWIKTDRSLSESMSLLESIDGIGSTTAMRLLVNIQDINHFDKAKQLACYAGLTPKIRQSGTSVNSSSMSKMGNPKLRKVLYMPAMAALRFNPIIQVFAQRLKDNGVTGKKMLVAIMRKLIHIVFAVLKTGKPFDREYECRA